jgi:cytochrome P450
MITSALLESVPQYPFLHAAAAVAAVCFLRLLYRRSKRISISHIPGPKKSDSFFGNLTDLHFGEVGEHHFRWQEEYGQVFKLHGLFGVRNSQLGLIVVYDLISQEEYLMISDPKAVQHVYTNSHSFVLHKHARNLLKMLFGPGLAVVDVDDHKRQRKVMQPAFGSPQLRNLFPVFIRHSQKVRPHTCSAPR